MQRKDCRSVGYSEKEIPVMTELMSLSILVRQHVIVLYLWHQKGSYAFIA
jgi:hypothetical protein